MSIFDDLLAGNAGFAASFDAGALQAPPTRRLAVVTCMDARILPLEAFGLRIGEAHILRNAGGRVSDDVILSLAVSTRALGVRSIAVVQHTECGMAKLDDDLRTLVGPAAIDDFDEALTDDVERLRRSSVLPADVQVAGFRYDVRTGRLHLVVPPPAP